jgi:carboxyvinyl-carboxyphosphonate phosphorylmutase
MISGKLVQEAGFEAVYLSGNGHTASHLGLPDAGYATLTDMLERVHNLARSVDLPVIADADTGYGNPLNVRLTVREYEQAGAAALHIEDQVSPKKCGHTLGRAVIPAEEMAAKIAAAVDARRSDDFLVIARCDARTTHGLDEAIRRGQLYARAGADAVFVESPESVDELRRIAAEIEAPCLANMVDTGRTPLLSAQELEALGFKLVIYPASAWLAAVFAMRELLAVLKRDGTPAAYHGRMATLEDYHALMGFPEVRELERKYAADRQTTIACERPVERS